MIAVREVLLRVLCAFVLALGACSDDSKPEADERPARSQDAGDDLRPDASPPPTAARRDAGERAAMRDAESKPQPPNAEPELPDAAREDPSDAQPPLDAGAPPTNAPDGAGEAAEDAGADDTPDASEPVADPELLALIDWVIDTLNEGRRPAGPELRQRFSTSFLAEVPEAELAATFAEISTDLRPIVPGEPVVDGLSATLRMDTAVGAWLLEIQVTTAMPRKIDVLYLRPAPAAAANYAEVVQTLQPLAAHTQLLVARVSPDGRCSPILEHATEERLAIGSAFKLWVLLALSQKLEADPTVSWTTRLPIREELKSLPSGVLQNQPNGTQVTLDEYASKMIEISDNTATDHLIDFVGRTAVEAAQTATQHSSPDANIPWLMTRELFALKLVLNESDRDAYRAASVPERRTLLEQYRSLPLDLGDAEGWTEPRALDLEWFATPHDLCQVLGTLGARASFSPSSQLLQILGANPGITFDAARFPFAGYKGGSEPGVLNLSWLLQRDDGAWFSVIITLNDSDNPISPTPVISAALALMPLVAAESGP